MGPEMRETSQNELYREVVPFLLMKFVIALMIVIAGTMLYLFIHQLIVGPLGDHPAPDWFYLIMFLVFLGVTGLVFQVRKLTIRANDQSITVAYGMLKYTIPWYRIDDLHLDTSSGWTYGGWGLLSINEMGHFLNRTLWHNQAA